MKRLLLFGTILAGGFHLGSVAQAQLPPIVSTNPKLPNGGDIPSVATVCWNGTALVYCQPATASGSGSSGAIVNANWTDVSFTASTTAAVPTGLGSSNPRLAMRLWNNGTTTVCISETTTASVSSGQCGPGSFPLLAGNSYFDEPPGNVSQQAVSVIAISGSPAITAWVR